MDIKLGMIRRAGKIWNDPDLKGDKCMGEIVYRILNHNVYRVINRNELKFIQFTGQEIVQEKNNLMICVGKTNSDENASECKRLLEEKAMNIKNRLLS